MKDRSCLPRAAGNHRPRTPPQPPPHTHTHTYPPSKGASTQKHAKAARNLNELISHTKPKPARAKPVQRKKEPSAGTRAPPMRVSTRVRKNATRPPPQKLDDVHNLLRADAEPGIERVRMEDMGGYGVVTTSPFYKGDYVCEYSGDLYS